MSKKNKLYLSISEFAELAGLSKGTVKNRIKEGRLPAHKPNGCGKWFIHTNWLSSFMAGQAPVGTIRKGEN